MAEQFGRWDRFDICLAYYVFAMYFHGGQGSATYSIYNTFHRLRYEPRAMANGDGTRSMLAHGEDYSNARDILAGLIRRWRASGKRWEPRRRN